MTSTSKSLYKKLVTVKNEIKKRANLSNPPISILTTGSVEYGYNSKFHGKMDDVDCIFILEEKITYEQLKKSLETDKNALFDYCNLPEKDEYFTFIEGNVNVLRLYGYIKNIEISIDLITLSTFISASKIIDYPLKLLFPNLPKYYVTDYWHNLIGFGAFISGNRKLKKINDKNIVMEEYIFRSIETNPKRNKILYTESSMDIIESGDISDMGKKLGISFYQLKHMVMKGGFGDKFIQADIIYESPYILIENIQVEIWSKFLNISIKQNSQITNEIFISSFARSSRFSHSFKKKLLRKLNLDQSNTFFYKTRA